VKVLFSSWNGEVVDNREIALESWKDAPLVKLPVEFDLENNITAFMGWDGIILAKEGVHIVDMCAAYMQAVQKKSCGIEDLPSASHKSSLSRYRINPVNWEGCFKPLKNRA